MEVEFFNTVKNSPCLHPGSVVPNVISAFAALWVPSKIERSANTNTLP